MNIQLAANEKILIIKNKMIFMEGTTKEEGDEKNSETVPPNVAKLEAKRGNGTRNCFLVLYRTPPPERRSFLLIKWSQ